MELILKAFSDIVSASFNVVGAPLLKDANVHCKTRFSSQLIVKGGKIASMFGSENFKLPGTLGNAFSFT